jgi:hypothetical protein
MNGWNLRNYIHIDNNHYEMSEYEQFSYGFFGVICLAFAIVVHVNQNFEFYDYYFGEFAVRIHSLMITLGIMKDHEEELPLYAPLVKCNSEHDVIAINIKSPVIKKETKQLTPEELV